MISATFDISSWDAWISAQVAHLTSGLAKVVTDAAALGQLKNVEAGPVLTMVDLGRVSGVGESWWCSPQRRVDIRPLHTSGVLRIAHLG